MEFSHLSSATRKKIEDFRRRRKEAEEYNENSPVKPPKVCVSWPLHQAIDKRSLIDIAVAYLLTNAVPVSVPLRLTDSNI